MMSPTLKMKVTRICNNRFVECLERKKVRSTGKIFPNVYQADGKSLNGLAINFSNGVGVPLSSMVSGTSRQPLNVIVTHQIQI